MSFVWTDENTAKASRLWREGYAGSYIAREIGATRNAVVGKAYRMRDMFPARTHSPNSRVSREAREKPKRVRRAPRIARPAINFKKPDHDAEVFQVKLTSKALVDLGEKDCRWPEGDRFCGKSQHGTSSYCEYHHSHSVDLKRTHKSKSVKALAHHKRG